MTSEDLPSDEADAAPVQRRRSTYPKEGGAKHQPGTTYNFNFGNISENANLFQAQQFTSKEFQADTTPFINEAVSIDRISPAVLQVHQAVLPNQETGSHPFLTPYLRRAHDDELRKYIKLALDGQTSVLAMMTGDSSVGKTRALYDVLYDLAPKRVVLRPRTITDLLFILNNELVDDKVVLWLNEAQHYFQGSGSPEAAASLYYLLMHRKGIVAVGTLWITPYWEKLTRAGIVGDPHGQVRELLMCPATVRISVPDHLSISEQSEWRRLAFENDDRRMFEALEAGVPDLGRVVQHLSGGPELLKAYLDGPGFFTRVEHALLTVAIFARCLGYQAPFSAALLAQAADGVLDPRERPIEAGWARIALKSLSTGQRSNGQRVDIRSTLTALHTFVPYGETEPLYELDDYLEQHLSDHFSDQLASPPLWQALLEHANNPDDLRELAEAASYDGLIKHAICLYHKAVSAEASGVLSGFISLLSPETDPYQQAAFWAVSRVDIKNPGEVADLLRELRKSGFKEAVDELLRREPAVHVSLADLSHVGGLLKELREAQQGESLAHLAGRIASCVDFPDPSVIPRLLCELLESEQEEAADALALYAADYADITCPYTVATLLHSLRRYGYEEELVLLMDRDPVAQVDLTDPGMLAIFLDTLAEFGFESDICKLMARSPVAHIDLINRFSVALLMDFLVQKGWLDEARFLVARCPVSIPKIVKFDPADLPKKTSDLEVGGHEGMEELFPGSSPSKTSSPIEIYGRELDGSPARPWEWSEIFSSDL